MAGPRLAAAIMDALEWDCAHTGQQGTADGRCAECSELRDKIIAAIEIVARPASTTQALYDALLPLCDDLPGEPPALLAWSPSRLAEVIAQGLAANGYAITREALCSRSGGCRG